MTKRILPFIAVLAVAVLVSCTESPTAPKEADPHPVAFVVLDGVSGEPLPYVDLQVKFEAPGTVSFLTLDSPKGYTEKKLIYQDDEPRTCEVFARAFNLPLQYHEFRGTVELVRAKYPGENAVIRIGEVRLSRSLPIAGGGR